MANFAVSRLAAAHRPQFSVTEGPQQPGLYPERLRAGTLHTTTLVWFSCFLSHFSEGNHDALLAVSKDTIMSMAHTRWLGVPRLVNVAILEVSAHPLYQIPVETTRVFHRGSDGDLLRSIKYL